MACWKARAEFLLSVIELLLLSLMVQALQDKMFQHSLPSGGCGSDSAKISGGRGRPPANIFIPLERQLNALQLPKDENSQHFDPHFEEVRGGVERCWMARWKARTKFLLSLIELLFLSLTVEALQGKTCQNSQPSGVGRSL